MNNNCICSKIHNIFIEKNNTEKTSKIKSFFAFFILVVFIIGALILQYIGCKEVSYVIALITQFVFCSILLIGFISIFTEKYYSYKQKIIMGSFINFLFAASAIILTSNKILGTYGYVISLVLYVLLFFLIYYCVKIDTEHDLSALKATNYFFAAIITSIIYLIKNDFNNCNVLNISKDAEQLLEFYYLIPLGMLQGLYELLEGKAKK